MQEGRTDLQAIYAEVSVVASSHVQAEGIISLEGVVCVGVTYAASLGCHLLKVAVQGLICTRKVLVADKDVWTPFRSVPQVMNAAGPVGPGRGLWFYPGGNDNLQTKLHGGHQVLTPGADGCAI